MVYVTPKSFLAMLNNFEFLLKERYDQIDNKKDRYINGVKKLDETSSMVKIMADQLEKLKPELEKKTEETEATMKVILNEFNFFVGNSSRNKKGRRFPRNRKRERIQSLHTARHRRGNKGRA
jgi:hypothetical protein